MSPTAASSTSKTIRCFPSVSPVLLGLLLIQSANAAVAADWPMRGRDHSRNAVVADAVGPTDWQIVGEEKEHRNVRWIADVGTVSQGDPVVSDGLVWIGTNNGRPRDPSQGEDASMLMCFDERNGKFLYQYVSPRLPLGRSVDWPGSSLSSSPLVEKDRLWFCNNRCEVICLNIAPLLHRTGEPTFGRLTSAFSLESGHVLS